MPDSQDDAVEVVVTIEEGALGRIKSLADALKKSGLKVGHVLETSGIVSGTARPADFERLRKHKGVSAVEVAGDVSIPPPDSDIQ